MGNFSPAKEKSYQKIVVSILESIFKVIIFSPREFSTKTLY